MKRIGIFILTVVITLALLPFTSAAAADYGTVTGGWLRLRTAPSYDATVIKSYYTGTVVEILGTSGDWYSVKAPDNQAGYMHSDYITLGGSGGTTITKYVTSANGYGVKLRTGPGKGYSVLAVYVVGTKVTVLQTGTIWSRIQIGTTVGYMMSEYLTSANPGTSPTTPESDDMATIWSANGYGVRLRSEPNTNADIIGLYSVGTRVAVQSRGAEWDYILVGSRLGYMMNEFLIYDNPSGTVATGITVTADSATGMQGEYVNLDVTVTGIGLSSPAYTLAVTGNAGMAEISGGDLHILSTATVGAVITVTATTTDDDADGDPITDTCTVTVTAAAPRVSAFSFDETTASASVAGGDVERRIGYTISGVALSSPPFSLAVSGEAGGNVTATIDTGTEEIVLNISAAIAPGTVFTVTGTTTDDDAGGNPKTATVTVTITDDAVSLTSIELLPEETTLRHDETASINAKLHYSDGSYALADLTTDYTLEITSGSGYASLSTKLLVPNAASLVGVANQTVTVKGTSVANPLLTDTCDVLLYGRNKPGAPSLTGADAAYESVTLTWTPPASDGGDDLTGFKAYYSLTEGGAKSLLSAAIGAGDTEYTATGLLNGTTYYFWMAAVNAQGDSGYSNTLTAEPAATAPSVVQNLAAPAADIGDGTVKLTWMAPAQTGGTGVTIGHYRVYIDDGDNPTYEYDSAGRSANLNKTITGLTNGQVCTFLVLAVNSEGLLGPTASVDANAVGTPDAPTISLVMDSHERLYVQWTPGAFNGGSAIQDYDVYIKVEGDPDPGAPAATVAATEYTFLGLTNNTTYEVWVTANNGYYDSAASPRETGMPMAP